MSEINVTPMVDVMLVLLIVFMVTAPLIQQGVPVELPRTRAQSMDADPDRVVLTLTADRRVFIAAAEVPLPLLRARLAENRKLQADRQIYLHADRALPYGFVVDVMATLKDAGVEGLGMVTDPLQGAPSR